MHHLEVKKQITPTYRIIYVFDINACGIEYKGVFHSNRNDENDTWGDEWGEKYNVQHNKEINEHVASKDCDADEWGRRCIKCDRINNKYNPIKHKTIRGETYYSGVYFGCEKSIPCLLTDDEIRAAAIDHISKLKIRK